MYSPYNNEDQIEKLLRLNAELSQSTAPVKNNHEKDIAEQTKVQSTYIDNCRMRNMINRVCDDSNECRMCQSLQSDMRYILINILNTQEQIKTSVRRTENFISLLDINNNNDGDDEDGHFCNCLYYPFVLFTG